MCEDEERKPPPKVIQACWDEYEKRPTWSVVSGRELSKILGGVSLNTLCNWRLRDILPESVVHPNLKGNRTYYRISTIISWLTGQPESAIHWRWLETYFDLGTPFASLKQAEEMVKLCLTHSSDHRR